MDTTKQSSNFHYLSLGEGCLTDNILKRHGIKSFSTPYSHGRSNIDYAIELERSRYSTLLDKETLYYATEDYLPKGAVRSKSICDCDNIFNVNHSKGFEFTHHDVINNEEHRQSYIRKIARMSEMRNEEKEGGVCFFYNYRNNPNMNFDDMLRKVQIFLQFYNSHRRSIAAVFSQKIIGDDGARTVVKKIISDDLYFFEFHTLQLWAGTNQNIFWARTDDDLIKVMIDDMKKVCASQQRADGL